MSKKTWIVVCSICVLLLAAGLSCSFVSLKTFNGYPIIQVIQDSEFVCFKSEDTSYDPDIFVVVYNRNKDFKKTLNDLRLELRSRIKSESVRNGRTALWLQNDIVIYVEDKVASKEIVSDIYGSGPKEYKFKEGHCSIQLVWQDPLPKAMRQFIGIKLPHQ